MEVGSVLTVVESVGLGAAIAGRPENLVVFPLKKDNTNIKFSSREQREVWGMRGGSDEGGGKEGRRGGGEEGY